MDELLREFLTETSEHLDVVDVELVRFELDPNNATILQNIFRLVHTIKGTCGFLSLPRLEALAHAAETAMGQFRDGAPVTSGAVTLILATIDRIKTIIAELDSRASEPEGDDLDLIVPLEQLGNPDPALMSAAERRRLFGPDGGLGLPAPAGPEPLPQAVPTGDGAPPPQALRAQTIRVTVSTLEHLMTMVSELVLTRNQLLDIGRREGEGPFKGPLQRLSYVTAELQEGVMQTRMQPIGTAWQTLPRVVRGLGAELGKKIDLAMHGAETELDRQVLEIIKDPLTHMVRNSADHGIEGRAERLAKGKPERGLIQLSAHHEGGTITIEIADDGRGLDYQRLRRAAVERRLASEAEVERMDDARVGRFIFHPGFSTATTVTAVSGRGVGMDVVKTNIELIGGAIDIQSERDRGTTFTIKIPLTLAIVAALIVRVAGHRLAIPQAAVVELVRVRPEGPHTIERLNEAPVLRLRDRLLPIVLLADLLQIGETRAGAEDGFVVVTQVGRQHFGMLVDGVFHTEEIVVKPMSRDLRHIPLFSGNTILGDGAVVLILDPNGICRQVGTGMSECRAPVVEEDEAAPWEESESVTLIVFRGSGPGLKAVPLSLVARLEEIDASRIEWVGIKPFLQYRGYLMPLVPVDPQIAIPREGPQPLIVFSDGNRAMGLLVAEIVDIIEEQLTIDPIAGQPAVMGSTVVRGQAAEIINVAHFLPLGHEDWLERTSVPGAEECTVLLVDDSAFFRNMVRPVLKTAGYRVIVATDADEAMAVFAAGRGVDIVVTDIEMPGKSGFELIKALRADQRTAAIPIVAISSYVHPAIAEHARRLGVAAFVAKFDRSGLIAALVEASQERGVAA